VGSVEKILTSLHNIEFQYMLDFKWVKNILSAENTDLLIIFIWKK